MKIISNKPTITRKDLEAVLDCLIKDELTTGTTVKSFENEISDKTGFQYSVAVSSLTSAYHLAYAGLGIGPGDEVILQSYFDSAALIALSLTGGSAVLVDCDQNSLFPSEEAIIKKINERTKAIVIGNTFGINLQRNGLSAVTVPIIEDISPILGTQGDDVQPSFRSTIAVASFAVTMIITTGSGGMVMTNNSKHYSKIKDLRGGNGSAAGYDYTMTDMQGAMGITQLKKLNELLERRRKIAKIYTDALKLTSHKILYSYNESFTYQSFPVLFDASIEKVEKYWKKAGVEVLNPIKKPLHSILGQAASDFPNSERLSKKLFSIPLYPTLTKENIDYISRMISKFI